MPTKRLDPLHHMLHLIFQDVTPVRLRLFFVANFFGTLIFCLLTLVTVSQHEHAVETVGHDAAPSVIAANQIKIGVEKMDAALADQLLYKPGQVEREESIADFEKWRIVVGKQLVAAAKNITYGDTEQIPIENIQNALGQFEMLAQAARDAQIAGKNADALSFYRKALSIVEEKLLTSADALNKANSVKLESTYSQEESRSALSCGFLLAVGIVLVSLMVTTQIYLSKRFRRRLNVPLIIATLSTALFVQHLYTALRGDAAHLKLAKEDAYDSIVALLNARSNAYGADAAESRWLFDREQAQIHEKYFQDKVATVASFAPEHNFSETLARAEKQLAAGSKYRLPGFSGSLADELNNTRFEGEASTALEALKAFSEYCSLDVRMRHLESSGAHDRAVRTGLGYSPSESKYWFSKFDDALQRTLEINQEHFERAVNQAFHDLVGMATLSRLLFLFSAVCIYAGLRGRMAEYV
jgi:hypothetical protein